MWWNTKYIEVYIFIFFERHKWKKSLQRWTLTLEGDIGGVGEWTWCSISHFLKWSEVLTILFYKFWQSLWFRQTQCSVLFFLISHNRQTFCYFITAFTTHHMSYKYVCFLVQGHGYWTHPCVCSLHIKRGTIMKNGLWGEYHKEWGLLLTDRAWL